MNSFLTTDISQRNAEQSPPPVASKGVGGRKRIVKRQTKPDLKCPYFEHRKLEYENCKEARFSNLSRWKTHIWRHLRLHQCSKCGHRFAERYGLEHHTNNSPKTCISRKIIQISEAELQFGTMISALESPSKWSSEDIMEMNQRVQNHLETSTYDSASAKEASDTQASPADVWGPSEPATFSYSSFLQMDEDHLSDLNPTSSKFPFTR